MPVRTVSSMNRRMALAAAGTAALVLSTGSVAVAANLGILGAEAKEPVGKLEVESIADLSGTSTTVDPIVVTVDEIVPVPMPADDSDGAPSGPTAVRGGRRPGRARELGWGAGSGPERHRRRSRPDTDLRGRPRRTSTRTTTTGPRPRSPTTTMTDRAASPRAGARDGRGGKRRVVAPASRLLATGLSLGAGCVIVTALAVSQPPEPSNDVSIDVTTASLDPVTTTTTAAPPPTTIVVNKIYVPVPAGSSLPAGSGSGTGGSRSTSGSAAASGGTASPTAAATATPAPAAATPAPAPAQPSAPVARSTAS